MQDEDGPCVWGELGVVEAVAADLAIEEAVRDVYLAICEVALVNDLL